MNRNFKHDVVRFVKLLVMVCTAFSTAAYGEDYLRDDFSSFTGWIYDWTDNPDDHGLFASNGTYVRVSDWRGESQVAAERSLPFWFFPTDDFSLSLNVSAGQDTYGRVGAVGVALLDVYGRTVAKMAWHDAQASTGYGGVDFYAYAPDEREIYRTDPSGFGQEYPDFSGTLTLKKTGSQWSAWVNGIQKGPSLSLQPEQNVAKVQVFATRAIDPVVWPEREFQINAVSLTGSNRLQGVILPGEQSGQWYDQDKMPQDVKLWWFEDKDGDNTWKQGETWSWKQEQACWKPSNPWTTGWFDDLNSNLGHDPGEAAAKYPQLTWTNGREKIDNSCWLASAANMVQYAGGENPYDRWAYTEGVQRWPFPTGTFDDGGYINNPLNGDGFRCILWDGKVDPGSWVKDSLQRNLPVGIGFYGPGGQHALTIYGIDTSNQKVWGADSDNDHGGDFRECSYTYDGSQWYLTDYDRDHPGALCNIYYATKFLPFDWRGSGTGGDYSTSGWTTEWNNAVNWSIGTLIPEVPTKMDMVEIFFKNPGRLNITGSASAYRLDINGSSATVFLEPGASLNVTGHTYVGNSESGFFSNNGGNHTIDGDLYVGNAKNSVGSYSLLQGNLIAKNEYLGVEGAGRIVQYSGTNAISQNLYLGYCTGSEGAYELSGTGKVTAANVVVGNLGAGLLTVNSGEMTLGMLEVGNRSGTGVLNITNNTASITISDKLILGANSEINVVPNSTIHMTGSAFENYSTSPDKLSDMINLNMVFEGGVMGFDYFEVAGVDIGATTTGFTDNFALGTLTLGGVDIGNLRLIDTFDNQPNWVGPEALYVRNLILGHGSYLDLNGLNLYYLDFTNLGGTFVNGTPTLVPAPTALGLAVIGLIVALGGLNRLHRRQSG